MLLIFVLFFFFFFNDTATTEIYTLSLHDALPISANTVRRLVSSPWKTFWKRLSEKCKTSLIHLRKVCVLRRSEEHTSELQSQSNLVCRLLLEKKKKKKKKNMKSINIIK